ncbi:molybdate ABC transporter substrate-binding protein [Otariodibacter sp.]|uniref:molybdate ABC transporter substrate-binding protein n=1 Tax=Otariodibacter sp. TaxID=3030919 RepID=UPI00262AA935|nr:molybdate ABC transporter substrate-binding protein [Otariodibacter sp.]
MLKKSYIISLYSSLLLANIALAQNITVFAAASMTDVLQQIGDEYKKQHPDDDLIFSFAGSSTLAKQIEQDAPADIFISADEKWMDYLSEKLPKKVQNRTVLVENELVLIAPKSSSLELMDIKQVPFKKLTEDSYLAVGDDNVPVGRYAKTALTNLNLWHTVESRLSKAKDVRAVLTYIARDELPLGIVYSTDAKISDDVKVVSVFPQESYGKVVYPAATLTDKAEAKSFLDFLSSKEAKSFFKSAGFKSVEK